jgi:hypothetical protein
MDTQNQAYEYVARVGTAEAQRSNHYLTAKRHCRCGSCFCCEVKALVDAQNAEAKRIIDKILSERS